MAYDEQTFDGQFSASAGTDALFRSYVSAVRTALTNAGLVRTSDTGQIDPTTVSKPTSGSDAGYEIWRFDDDDQSTDPLFFKITYGGGSSNGYPRIKIIVGTGSNGSGTISNASTEVSRDMSSAGAASGRVIASLFDGELTLWIWNTTGSTSSNNCQAWVLGRARDADGGEPIGSGTHYLRTFNGTAYLRSAGNWSSYNSIDVVATSVVANKCVFGHHRCVYPMAPYSPLLGVPGTLAGGDEGVTDLLDGTTATYKLPSGGNTNFVSSAGPVAIRNA